MNAVIYACYSSDGHADADILNFVSSSYDLTIDKIQVTIHIHSGRTSPNSPARPDPDSDPSVRERVWTQWIKPCKIPHFSLTERMD